MKIPYGYYYNDQGVITIDEEKAKVIQMIFDMYIAGSSLRTISHKLSERNILTPTGKQKWSAETIDKMISKKSLFRSFLGRDSLMPVLKRTEDTKIFDDPFSNLPLYGILCMRR